MKFLASSRTSTTMFSLFSLIFVVFVSPIPRVALAQEPAPHTLSTPIDIENDSGVSNENDITEKLFIKSFVRRRKEHLNAVKNIRNIDSYEKRYKMVSILTENALNIVETSRNVIIKTKFVPGDTQHLKNMTTRAALSSILENCALVVDVVLQLPDIAQRIMKRQKNWAATITWALKFVEETRHLLDEPTLAMFHLVRQELNIIPRDETYTNPYWPKSSDREETAVKDKKSKKKDAKKSKSKKGPRMVNFEL